MSSMTFTSTLDRASARATFAGMVTCVVVSGTLCGFGLGITVDASWREKMPAGGTPDAFSFSFTLPRGQGGESVGAGSHSIASQEDADDVVESEAVDTESKLPPTLSSPAVRLTPPRASETASRSSTTSPHVTAPPQPSEPTEGSLLESLPIPDDHAHGINWEAWEPTWIQERISNKADVLVIVGGDPRTWVAHVHANHMQHVIEPLSRLGKDGRGVDVYVMLKHANQAQLRPYMEQQPEIVGYHFMGNDPSERQLLGKVGCRSNFIGWLGPDVRLARYMMVSHNYHIAYIAMRKLEAKRGKRYNFVIYLRPDSYYAASFAWWKQKAQTEEWQSRAMILGRDWSVFMPRTVAEDVLLRPSQIYHKSCTELRELCNAFKASKDAYPDARVHRGCASCIPEGCGTQGSNFYPPCHTINGGMQIHDHENVLRVAPGPGVVHHCREWAEGIAGANCFVGLKKHFTHTRDC